MVTEPRDYGHLKDGWQYERAALAKKPTFKNAPEI